MPRQQPPNPKSEQHKRFIETARQLECDEDKERFEEKLKQIATAKPKVLTPSSRRPRKRRNIEKTG
jgi:hypothetical protein